MSAAGRGGNIKKKGRSYPYNEKFAFEFGLRVTGRNDKTGLVESAVCRFCECWGREYADSTVGDEEGGRKKRKLTTNYKHFLNRIFRSDNMRLHLREQHPIKFKEYMLLRTSSAFTADEIMTSFFSQPTLDAFFKKRTTIVGRKRIVTIDKSIVEVVVAELLLGGTENAKEEQQQLPTAAENQNTNNEGRLKSGDRGMQVFVPQLETTDDGLEVVSCYTVVIANTLQFDYVVSLLGTGLSFRQIARVIQENRDRLGCASKTGYASEGEVSCFARIVCAIGLQIIADIMSRTWAFAIGSDVATDDFGHSHLDVRVRFPGIDVGDDLLSFHLLLAIPLFEESYSGESLYTFCSKVFDALCPTWKERIIGSSTDGAPNMTGCNVGFTTRLANAAGNNRAFYRVWCLAHQLDLIIKASLHAIANATAFQFMTTLTTAIGWLRRQDTLIRGRMGSKCPYFINVRWTSVSKVLKWMLSNKAVICRYFEEKRYVNKPPPEWWMVAIVVNDFLVNVNATFTSLQVESAVVSKQYDSLRSLCALLKTASSSEQEPDRSMEEPLLFSKETVSKGQFKVLKGGLDVLMRGIDVDAAELYRELLDDHGRNTVILASAVLYLSALHGLTVVIAGRQAAGRESSPVPPCLPVELINTSNVNFVTLVGSHKHALRSCFGDAFLQTVCQQHKLLVRVVAQEAPLSSQLHARVLTHMVFSKSWAPCGSRFKELRQFAAGLATVMPTTSRVEGDFSLMCYRRNTYSSALTDFALEGAVYAKQYDDLQVAASKL